MVNIPDIFASMVFDDEVMKKRLTKDVYSSLRQTIAEGKELDITVANSVANAMKDWAVEKGVTHYTHWFQPLTGITAEKHDSFISPQRDGKIIMEFSGKELIKGEPDASSFPSGGLRATFEARGYTAWDPTSYAFIKDGALCIPTAFCSYGGESLDQKTPLLRSMKLLSDKVIRILRLFGNEDVKRVFSTIGPEQEYFLIDQGLFMKRKDLIFCGRTLFGAKPPKGQELDDHYYGPIKPRVMAFMKELDRELWTLGVLAKTKHNEAAPAQHELAPVFETANVSIDHNQLTMETMKKVAANHGLVCLLHEKPFEGVNGSGKHNNWSMATDTGLNLLEPGSSPQDNAQFMLFLTAVIKAVDDYQDLLRASVSSAGNDHRLGANEAPPAIISIFLGDELTGIMEAIEQGIPYKGIGPQEMEIGVDVLPHFPKDNTDRNRTSPFAFTGNKFEFRMLGSSMPIANANIVLNLIVAEVLDGFADELEGTDDFTAALRELIIRSIKEHKRIIFNGDGYSREWEEEAERRGLLNLKSTVEALPYCMAEKNLKLYTKHRILTEAEVASRYEILLETYSKTINIEALTMVEMARKEILPAVVGYVNRLSQAVLAKQKIGDDIPCEMELNLLKKLSALSSSLYHLTDDLDRAICSAKGCCNSALELAAYYRDEVFTRMQKLRAVADEIEANTAADLWPFPTYGDLLFNI
ncbi:MAG: glutamine synthetase III [Christensenellales bacterium]|jgi:glutamine synthetase